MGFVVDLEVEEQSSDTVDEGLVIGTDPAIGRTVKEGTTVKLIVSTGEQTYVVENLTGRNYKEEKGKLEVYGLEVIIEQRTVSDDTDYDSEEIIGQSVDPGTELKKEIK